MITLTLSNGNNTARLELPIGDSYILSMMTDELSINTNSIRRPVHVERVEYPEQLYFLAGKDVNLDEVNYLAKRLESFMLYEMTQYFAALKHEGFRNLKSLINLTFNLDKYTLITDVSNPTVIGKEYVINTEGAIPADGSRDEEFASIGRMIIAEKRGELTEFGLLIVEDKPITQYYDGKTFPLYDYYGSLMFVGIEYEGREEGVSIGEDPSSIRTALQRLGANSSDDCQVRLLGYNPNLDPFMGKMKVVLEKEGIEALASLAQKIYQVNPDIPKLNAVADYCGVHTSANLKKIIDNIEAFIFVEGAEDAEDVGRFYVYDFEDAGEYYVSQALEDYVDFQQFGKDIMSDHFGEFVNGGYVCFSQYNGQSFLDSLEPEDTGVTMGGVDQ